MEVGVEAKVEERGVCPPHQSGLQVIRKMAGHWMRQVQALPSHIAGSEPGQSCHRSSNSGRGETLSLLLLVGRQYIS